MLKKTTIVCLMGPTASGKTQMAIELCQRLPFDIISVDSTMIYRGMDIGSAKPTEAELVKAPHRLIDIREPYDTYSVAEFCKDAKREIINISKAGRIPLLVGGTMLYFRALQEGLSTLPPSDPAIRKQILDEAQAIGWGAIHQRLAELDPESAARIHPNDPQRLQRALEVNLVSGQTMAKCWEEGKERLPFNVINVALMPKDRQFLHERIERRFYQLLESGFVEEVSRIKENEKINPNLPSMRSVGYRQIYAYLLGEISEEKMVESGIFATRQLAKRQLTWLRKWKDIMTMEIEDKENLGKLLIFLKNVLKL